MLGAFHVFNLSAAVSVALKLNLTSVETSVQVACYRGENL